MDQLMMLGQNLGSGLFKPEDYFANLQAMNGAAQASGDEEGTGVAAGGAHGMDGLDDLEGSPGPNSDKPLTSKFRWVPPPCFAHPVLQCASCAEVNTAPAPCCNAHPLAPEQGQVLPALHSCTLYCGATTLCQAPQTTTKAPSTAPRTSGI
eukprot:1159664-Pelagomonas_calceolata.AAC.4